MARLTLAASLLASLAIAGCAGHPCTGAAESECREPIEVSVVRVIDGDTFDVDPPVELGS